jgi:hypothetical protein
MWLVWVGVQISTVSKNVKDFDKNTPLSEKLNCFGAESLIRT